MKRFRLFRWSYYLQEWLGQHLTIAGWAILTGIVISGVAGADTYQTLAYQIFTFLLSIFTIAVGYSFFFRPHLRVHRSLARFATVGVPLTYRLTLHNPTARLQTGLKLFEQFIDPRPTYWEFMTLEEPHEAQRNRFDRRLGYYRWLWLVSQNRRARVQTIDLPPVPPYGQIEVTVELQPLRRGPAHLTGVVLARPDPFGLFLACRPQPLPQSLWILPQRYPLPPCICWVPAVTNPGEWLWPLLWGIPKNLCPCGITNREIPCEKSIGKVGPKLENLLSRSPRMSFLCAMA